MAAALFLFTSSYGFLSCSSPVSYARVRLQPVPFTSTPSLVFVAYTVAVVVGSCFPIDGASASSWGVHQPPHSAQAYITCCPCLGVSSRLTCLDYRPPRLTGVCWPQPGLSVESTTRHQLKEMDRTKRSLWPLPQFSSASSPSTCSHLHHLPTRLPGSCCEREEKYAARVRWP